MRRRREPLDPFAQRVQRIQRERGAALAEAHLLATLEAAREDAIAPLSEVHAVANRMGQERIGLATSAFALRAIATDSAALRSTAVDEIAVAQAEYDAEVALLTHTTLRQALASAARGLSIQSTAAAIAAAEIQESA